MRRVQRRGGRDGEPLPGTGTAFIAGVIPIGSDYSSRRLRHSAGLGGWPFDGTFFVRLSQTRGWLAGKLKVPLPLESGTVKERSSLLRAPRVAVPL